MGLSLLFGGLLGGMSGEIITGRERGGEGGEEDASTDLAYGLVPRESRFPFPSRVGMEPGLEGVCGCHYR